MGRTLPYLVALVVFIIACQLGRHPMPARYVTSWPEQPSQHGAVPACMPHATIIVCPGALRVASKLLDCTHPRLWSETQPGLWQGAAPDRSLVAALLQERSANAGKEVALSPLQEASYWLQSYAAVKVG